VSVEKIYVSGARGENIADVARRIGSIDGVPVSPTATDGQILDALVQAAGFSPSLLASVQTALDSASLAELAALTAPGVYADVASGLAATAEGATFWVKEDDGLVLYRKVGGSAEMVDIISTTVDVRKYGADPTGTTSSTAAFQLATDFVASRDGGVVFVPPGEYEVEGVTLRDGVHYVGLSNLATILRLSASPAAHMFSAAPAATFGSGGMRHIQLDGGQDPNTAAYDAIDFSNVDKLEEFHIDSLHVHNFRRGFNGSLGTGVGNDRFPVIRFSRFEFNSIGVYTNEHAMLVAVDLRNNDVGLDGRINDLICVLVKANYNRVGVSGNDLPVTNSYFGICTFFANQEHGLKLGTNSTVIGSMFSGLNDSAARGGAGDVGIIVEGDSVNISGGNRFGQQVAGTSFADAAILIKPIQNQVQHGPQIIGNNFQLRGAGVGIRQDLDGRTSHGLMIQGNYAYSDGRRFAVLEKCSSLQVQNNNAFYSTAMAAGEAWLSWTELIGGNRIVGNVADSLGVRATGHLLGGPVSTPVPDNVGYETLIADNHAQNFAAGIIAITGTDNNEMVYRTNKGFVTKNSGEAVIAQGATTATVNHGLARTPARKNISATPIHPNSAALNYYITNVTATTFDLVSTTAAGANAAFTWRAEAETI